LVFWFFHSHQAWRLDSDALIFAIVYPSSLVYHASLKEIFSHPAYQMQPSEGIAIVGSACRLPGDVTSPSSLWELLVDPKDLLVSIPKERFNSQGFYHKNGQLHGHTNVNKSYLLSGDNDVRKFDALFFGITPLEANTIDPQVRLLLEVVFEALENGNQSIESLRGSETAVYSGMMVSDYEHMMSRDEDTISNHHVTGTARSLMSNRISYFFDWHGPSMTIDTACSSSLYAVHYAVQQLRSGASQVAVATGSNLLLDPLGYIGESKLQMLSPTGRSRMWDASADGYARGEGVAAIVLKTVARAEKDGDIIQCVIRETAVNQDGKTRGITV
jgi:hybrid polyketide synthase/nonribosomal peptide synthetase ACE1